jgi:hypothetical protein
VPFSLGNLGPSPRKIHYSSGKWPFSPGNVFYSIGNLLGIDIFFSLREITPLREITFKNYLNVLWIFSSISFVGKLIEKRIEP